MNIKQLQTKSTRWMTRSAAILGAVGMMATTVTPLVVTAKDIYTVEAGDNLYRIAVDYGTTEEHLMAINGLSTNLLQIGQQIVLQQEGPNEDGSTPNPVPDQTGGVYTVQAGDNLWAIAQANGTTEEYLMAINGLSSNLLQIGQQISLSGDAGYTEPTPNQPVDNGVHVVVAGDNLWDIAQRYGTTEEYLMAINGLSSNFLQIGDLITVYGDVAPVEDKGSETVDTPSDGVYVVVAGDNLWDIAQWFGTTEEQLMAWNGMANNFLQIGDRISVDGPADVAAPVETQPTTPTETETETAPVSSDSDVYIVQKGDNLWNIAKVNGTTEEYLMEINGLPTNLLQIGQEIRLVAEDGTETPTPPTEATNPNARKVILPRVHVVREGEDTVNIARQYFIEEKHLLEWNELTDATITVGDELFVTNPNIKPKIHVFKEGDTLDSLATEYKTTVKNIEAWNFLKETDEIVVGDELVVSDPTARSYPATPGETLNEIAQKHEVTVQELREWNNLPAEAILVNGTLYVSDPTGDKDEEETEATEATESAATEETSTESSEEISEETTEETSTNE